MFLLDGQPILVFSIYCCYNVWFSIHSLYLIIILDSPSILIFIWPIYFSSYSTRPCLMGYFICSVIIHVSQPHSTIGLIIVVYVFGFVCFDKYLDFIIFERACLVVSILCRYSRSNFFSQSLS
jgi:hypothetical protein